MSLNFNPISHTGHSTLLNYRNILPDFRMGTFQAFDDLNVKWKIVSFNSLTLEMSLDFNPICHGGYLTIFNHQSIYPDFQIIIFHGYNDLDVKIKVVSLNG